ncbi:MAG: hypothetical protein VZR09_11375 [Candidatus Gastranaerophilaceae bacterium]|nr:hypothetical protein [Candidatus Gastranaerophilaceae bacterium]
MEVNTIIGLAKIMKAKKPFYASELEIDGSVMSALSAMGIIEKTGRTKSVLVHLHDDVYKKATIYQWKNKIDKRNFKDLKEKMENERSVLECWDKMILSKKN